MIYCSESFISVKNLVQVFLKINNDFLILSSFRYWYSSVSTTERASTERHLLLVNVALVQGRGGNRIRKYTCENHSRC